MSSLRLSLVPEVKSAEQQLALTTVKSLKADLSSVSP